MLGVMDIWGLLTTIGYVLIAAGVLWMACTMLWTGRR